MKVTLTHEDVLEACKEWVENHYGCKVQGNVEIIATLLGNNPTVYNIHRTAVTFTDVPKPEGGPYRTPA